jgi:hypothetical protein
MEGEVRGPVLRARLLAGLELVARLAPEERDRPAAVAACAWQCACHGHRGELFHERREIGQG